MNNPTQSQKELPRIIVILGPTSAGKSATTIEIAQKFNGEIISVDSRQIYRGMDVGTGKVTAEEQSLVPHHMLDIIDPQATFNVAEFKKIADKTILDILQRHKLPILCGGTGLWIKSIVDNITYPEVEPNWELRNLLGFMQIEELFIQLQTIDPERAKSIDSKNKVRLIRALEICSAIGSVPKEKIHPQYQTLQIGISVPKDILHTRIKKRLNNRWKDGMIEEVEKLHQQGISWEKIQSFGLSYFWIPQYLQKTISLDDLYEKVYLAEKNYAKRQMTWFAKDPRIIWLERYDEIVQSIKLFLEK